MDPVPRLSLGAQPDILEGRADAIFPVVRDDFVTLRAPFLVLRGQRERDGSFPTSSSTCQPPQTCPPHYLRSGTSPESDKSTMIDIAGHSWVHIVFTKGYERS